jgi:hypothetical protein
MIAMGSPLENALIWGLIGAGIGAVVGLIIGLVRWASRKQQPGPGGTGRDVTGRGDRPPPR